MNWCGIVKNKRAWVSLDSNESSVPFSFLSEKSKEDDSSVLMRFVMALLEFE